MQYSQESTCIESLFSELPGRDSNCVKALESIKVILSEAQGLYAYRTVLGWCIVGLMDVSKAHLKEMKCNNIYVHEGSLVKRANCHFALKGPVRETDIATVTKDV